MPQLHTSEPRFESDTTGPVVRRSWKLIVGSQGPLLTGLFGFPWREPVLQAKCTQTEIIGRNELFSNLRVDRRHRSVPSLDCTCGIYATDGPAFGRLQRLSLRSSVIVTGFVRLSGRVLLAGDSYRAEEAQICGPLTITPPAPSRLRTMAARWGANQQIRRVTRDADSFIFWYSGTRRGVSIGEWYKQMSEALSRRYAVEVAGLVPPFPGLADYSPPPG